MVEYVQLHFVDASPANHDYRPAVAKDGCKVVFERTPQDHDHVTALYVVDDLFKGSCAEPFLSKVSPEASVQTRPDWCWNSQTLAFCGGSEHSPISVWTCGENGDDVTQIENTHHYIYPSWSHDGTSLAVMNASTAADPQPSTTGIDSCGKVCYSNMNGVDSACVQVFGGMPAVSPLNSMQIAFAGQPDLTSWPKGKDPTKSGYNEAANYIFLNQYRNGAFTSTPLEPDANVKKYDHDFQGRAPAWSPDGRFVVFESDRCGGYAIFLFDTTTSTTTGPLTDPAQGAQHAKFFPDGTKIILAAFQNNESPPRGIAWADISSFLP